MRISFCICLLFVRPKRMWRFFVIIIMIVVVVFTFHFINHQRLMLLLVIFIILQAFSLSLSFSRFDRGFTKKKYGCSVFCLRGFYYDLQFYACLCITFACWNISFFSLLYHINNMYINSYMYIVYIT